MVETWGRHGDPYMTPAEDLSGTEGPPAPEYPQLISFRFSGRSGRLFHLQLALRVVLLETLSQPVLPGANGIFPFNGKSLRKDTLLNYEMALPFLRASYNVPLSLLNARRTFRS